MRDSRAGQEEHPTPRVSVVMAVYNAKPFLKAAIESVLAQTYSEWELLLVDDGSTDESTIITLDYAAEYPHRIKYLSHAGRANRGVSATRNLGALHARGEYIVILDADDVCEPNRLEAQVAFLDGHPEIGLVGSHYFEIDGRGNARPGILLPCSHTEICWHLLFNTPFIHSSVAFRRIEVLERVGGYDESIAYAHDYEYWVRITELVRVANLTLELIRYRVHDASLSTRLRGRDEMPRLRAARLARLLGWPQDDPAEHENRAAAMAALMLGWDTAASVAALRRAADDILQLQHVFSREQQLSERAATHHREWVRAELARHLALQAASRASSNPREALALWRHALRLHGTVPLRGRLVLKYFGRMAASFGLRLHLPDRRSSYG